MIDDFSGRPGAALVAGATGGLGSAIARMLAARGSALALTYHRNAEAADSLATSVEHAATWQLDLADAEASTTVLGEAAERFGGLHTVIYAAGPHVPMVHLSRITPAAFRSQLEQDTLGFFHLMRAALPLLRRSRGSLIAVTTAGTRRFPARDGLSTGPKGAVEALVRGVAAEEGRYGVRANCVGPGMLTDGMAARLIASGDLDERALDVARTNIPLRTFGTAEDIAEAVCFLSSDRARFITGQQLDVDGGYTV
ncbi:SDR family NAD(P)-dependent oxidoreductase [Micromonospora sp. NPDC020750]|uniref:SDR family NAD(P)-dependent oxidoreductase n=1 Tax=unclassified Micromonospora TaxID=2617518 RepID=UPI0037B595D5